MGIKSSAKPVIGVTGPGKKGQCNWWFFKYLIKFLGGRPVHIIPEKPIAANDIDALLISGGADVNPELYGKEPDSLPSQARKKRKNQLLKWLFYPIVQLYKEALGVGSSAINHERDAMEIALLKEAGSRNIPVLGICRGMQLMNVYFGGTLYHNINSLGWKIQYKKSVLPRKWIQIREPSLLNTIISHSRCRINSLHNQGVQKLGTGLQNIAKDQNGLTQALQKNNGSFFLGVQWHPEYLPYLKKQRKIFSSFIRAAQTNG